MSALDLGLQWWLPPWWFRERCRAPSPHDAFSSATSWLHISHSMGNYEEALMKRITAGPSARLPLLSLHYINTVPVSFSPHAAYNTADFSGISKSRRHVFLSNRLLFISLRRVKVMIPECSRRLCTRFDIIRSRVIANTYITFAYRQLLLHFSAYDFRIESMASRSIAPPW